MFLCWGGGVFISHISKPPHSAAFPTSASPLPSIHFPHQALPCILLHFSHQQAPPPFSCLSHIRPVVENDTHSSLATDGLHKQWNQSALPLSPMSVLQVYMDSL